MKTPILPDGVADSWFLIVARGEVYESRIVPGSAILANLADLMFGSKDAEHDELDQIATDLADLDFWSECNGQPVSYSIACGEDPDIEILRIDDNAARTLPEMALDLCHAIEAAPACEQQTTCSVLAAQLREALQRYQDTRPLTPREKAMIDRAWENHRAITRA